MDRAIQRRTTKQNRFNNPNIHLLILIINLGNAGNEVNDLIDEIEKTVRSGVVVN